MREMNFQHTAITGPLCELVRTLDFEMTLVDEMWPVRIELYQGIVDRSWFRCRVWQAENYRIQSTFPCDSRGKPQHNPSDEVILVDWSTNLPDETEWFQAETPEQALAHVLASILAVIERITGESGR